MVRANAEYRLLLCEGPLNDLDKIQILPHTFEYFAVRPLKSWILVAMRMTCFRVGYSRIVTEEAVKYLEGVLHSLVDAVCEEVGFRDGLDYNERMEKYKQITYVLRATFDALTAHYGWRRFRGEDEYDAREIMEQTDVYEEFEEYAVLGVRQITYTVMNFARWFAWFIQIRARAVPPVRCRSNVRELTRYSIWLPKKRGWDRCVVL